MVESRSVRIKALNELVNTQSVRLLGKSCPVFMNFMTESVQVLINKVSKIT